MKRIIALMLCVAMLMSFAAMLASCGSSEEEEDEDKGAIINMYYAGQVYDFDPALAYTDDEAIEVLSLIFSPLFTINENGKLEKELVKSYEYVEDEIRNEYKLEITLKETRWSDGRVIMADDVVYAWKRILACDSKSPAAPLLYDIKNAVAIPKDIGEKYDIVHWGTRFTKTPIYQKQISILSLLRENKPSIMLALSNFKYNSIIFYNRVFNFTKRVFNKIKRILHM